MLSKETMDKIDELIGYLVENQLKAAKEHGVIWSEELQDLGELLKNLASIQTSVVVIPNITVNSGEVEIERIASQIRCRMEQQVKKGKLSDLR